MSKQQWTLLKSDVESVVEAYPVKDFEVESCLLAEMYSRRLHMFTFFKPNSWNVMQATFTYSEAFAINKLLGKYSKGYNMFLRMHIEPYLPKPKA